MYFSILYYIKIYALQNGRHNQLQHEDLAIPDRIKLTLRTLLRYVALNVLIFLFETNLTIAHENFSTKLFVAFCLVPRRHVFNRPISIITALSSFAGKAVVKPRLATRKDPLADVRRIQLGFLLSDYCVVIAANKGLRRFQNSTICLHVQSHPTQRDTKFRSLI